MELNIDKRSYQLYNYICNRRVYTLKTILANYHLGAFWFYIPEIVERTHTSQTGELIGDWWGNLCCTVEDNVASLKSMKFLENETALQSIPCYRCDLTMDFDKYVKTHTEDVNLWAMETRKLSGLCVFDMDYFEEFLQKNCPIAYGLVDTYILLRELREVTSAAEVF